MQEMLICSIYLIASTVYISHIMCNGAFDKI